MKRSAAAAAETVVPQTEKKRNAVGVAGSCSRLSLGIVMRKSLRKKKEEKRKKVTVCFRHGEQKTAHDRRYGVGLLLSLREAD